MCLILFAHDCHPVYRLVIAANRDEFYDRPTATARFWDEAPSILAGRDLRGGGTWFGITRSGRIAAVTNYRDPASFSEKLCSRGELVSRFLKGNMSAAAYLDTLSREGAGYNGFNLLFADRQDILYCSNRGDLAGRVSPGIHGLSNHLLDTPWPKVAEGKAALGRILESRDQPAVDELFALLADRTPHPDRLLPDTGVGLDWERRLSPRFIASLSYGTRSSTILLIDRQDNVTFIERSFNREAEPCREVRHQFRIEDGW